ncbi:MAG: DnaB-like helicase C-terminal domain-containing protein, partial [Patescibacteria group bacterium]
MSYHSGNELIDPYFLFEKVHLHPGMHVADFGCGRTGHIIFPAASVLGDNSIIYAVDILKDVLESIVKRAKMDGLLNIHPVWGDMERRGGVAIPARSLDVVFLVNALGHAGDRHAVLEDAEAGKVVEARRQGIELPTPAIPTGFHDMDRLFAGGMWPGEVIVIAARPSVGKTTFAINIARKVACKPPEKKPVPVAIFSLE